MRKSLGFSWGPAGLSTALFTGVYLADVLEKVCPQHAGDFGDAGFRRAMHVIFEGAEDLPNGKYGTSQLLRWAKSREKGMMLAWAMNGEASAFDLLPPTGPELMSDFAGARARPRLPLAAGRARTDRRYYPSPSVDYLP